MDQITWKCKSKTGGSLRKSGGMIAKNTTRQVYHHLRLDRRSTSDFKKYIYHNEKTGVALVHYIGNPEVVERRPHGNATRRTRVYKPVSYIVDARIRELDPEGKMDPMELYNKLLTHPEYQHLSGRRYMEVMPEDMMEVKYRQSRLRYQLSKSKKNK
jgi:hypothetical protein